MAGNEKLVLKMGIKYADDRIRLNVLIDGVLTPFIGLVIAS